MLEKKDYSLTIHSNNFHAQGRVNQEKNQTRIESTSLKALRSDRLVLVYSLILINCNYNVNLNCKNNFHNSFVKPYRKLNYLII